MSRVTHSTETTIPMHREGTRLAWLDCLRLVAGISMLILHCTADPSGGAWASYDQSARVFPLVLRMFAYAARTELFIIISLFLLLLSLQKRPRGYFETIQDQSRRLLLPFLFWTLFYAGYSLIKAHHFEYFDSKLTALTSTTTWLNFLLLGSSKYHMHFLPTLFAVILAYPLMRKSVDAPVLGLAALVICLSARWQLDAYFYARFWDEPQMLAIGRSIKIATHIGYGMFAGACLGIWQRQSRQDLESWLPAVLYFAGLLFLFKGVATWDTIASGQWNHSYTPGFWADFTMPAILFLTCLLCGLRHWSDLFSRYAKYAFGIYLCHPIFLDLCEIILRQTDLQPWAQVTFKIGITLSCTTVFVLILSKTPGIAWTIGLGKPPRINPIKLFTREAT